MTYPLFLSPKQRGAGVLLHITSLPNAYGIGSMGSSAFKFIDFLEASGAHYWQILPTGPTGYGDSPYQPFSSFAGNPYFIDIEALIHDGLLEVSECSHLQTESLERIDYGYMYEYFWPVMYRAYNRYKQLCTCDSDPEYQHFIQTTQYWLEPYSLFMSLKSYFNGTPWFKWPEHFQTYDRLIASGELIDAIKQEQQLHKFTQYVFFKQWAALKAYASSKHVQLIGDVPIFVPRDSADVWHHPQLYQLDSHLKPQSVAGAPPDYFSADGQLWGNVLYDWEALKSTDYNWWVERLKANWKLVDWIRLDHFRGFESYWSVDYGAQTARTGKWRLGPGIDFFRSIYEACGTQARLIAENLGLITPEVDTLLDQTGIAGMAILQFAFDSDASNPYLPYNLKQNQVIYTGVHDNDTSLSWYASAPQHIQDYFRRYFDVNGSEAGWDLIRAAYRSICNLVIVPAQDLLCLGNSARLNTPGTTSGNWTWRMTHLQLEQLQTHTKDYLKRLAILYGRFYTPEVLSR